MGAEEGAFDQKIYGKTFVILTSINVLGNSARLALYFILVSGLCDSTVLKYLAWRTELPKDAVASIHTHFAISSNRKVCTW